MGDKMIGSRLNGKHILITVAAQGIGRASVTAMALESVHPFLLPRLTWRRLKHCAVSRRVQ
jgi:short-subunit dehydrogenase